MTVVSRTDPLHKASEIKALFARNDRADFHTWFDRAYPIARRLGASSWISTAPDGQVVAHVAGFVHRFWLGDRRISGALLCNLMVDQAHRNFFSAVSLLRKATRDIQACGAQFVYTNPMNAGAVAVLTAAKLARVGALNRFLFVLRDGRLPLDLALHGNIALRRITTARVQVRQCTIAAAVEWSVSQRCQVAAVTASRDPSIYFMRLGELSSANILAVQLHRAGTGIVGVALVRRHMTSSTECELVTLRCISERFVAGSVAAIAFEMRCLGMKRMQFSALDNTGFASALIRGGFVRRREPWSVMGAGYSTDGREVIRLMADSDLERIDLD